MQPNRNGVLGPASTSHAVPPPPIDRVCGLGLCDVLRVELENCQLESLRDEIDEQRHVFDDATALAAHCGDEESLDALRYEREVLEMIAKQVVEARPEDARVVVWGPARMVSGLVSGAAREAAAQLVEHVRRKPLSHSPTGGALIAASRIAAAWAETYVAVQAIEGYSFDPRTDHVRP
jgi:hypothetical protein